MAFLDKIFGDSNKKYLESVQPLVDKINNLEKEFEKFSLEQLLEKSKSLKERLKRGENLDDFLPEALALVRESSKRTLRQRHYNCQLVGGIVLHQGKIAEMKTGEGKTLASTLPVFLNALEGKGVHIVTVNDYLSRRDAVWMGQIYHLLGLSVGCINHEQSFLYDPEYKSEEKDKIRDELGSFKIVEDFLKPCSRKEAYLADITYGTNNEFGFDYLRDNMALKPEDKSQRGFNFAIVDEIDSILIDEARTPLIISAPDMESSKWYLEFARIIPKLSPETDYEVDEKARAVTLTEKGIERVEKILGMDNIYQEKGINYLHHLEQALRAQAVKPSDGKPLFVKDIHYVVKGGEVIIIDEFTGRLMPGRRWSGGLHQAIEAKEGVEVKPESKTLASITFQNYFKMYNKLSGMTGTAVTSAEEFDKVYSLEVIIIPTNLPMVRKNLPDRVYKTEKGKWKALVGEIKKRHNLGQPLLIGTRSVEKNEYLGKLLEREGISHEILNAKNHEREGEIIAQAGKLGQVTVATNMAGRGVDIILGGNPQDKEEAEKIKDLGGLHVIGTERHEARRIDNQLRGRAGRQGDPGSSQFFISLEDDLMRIFGGERLKSLMNTLKVPEDQPIEAKLISRAVESAQSKIEGMNFDARKYVLEYDNVMNKHRETIYRKREEILLASPEEVKQNILSMVKNQGIEEKKYFEKEKELGEENMRKVEKIVALKTLDVIWIDHLVAMEHLKDSVRLKAYGNQDPLVAYKTEGHMLFKRLLDIIEASIVNNILRMEIKSSSVKRNFRTTAFPKTGKKPSRNDDCPCGSGKKYKKCCWPKYG